VRWRPRTPRRWRRRYQLYGYDGLWDRRRQQLSPRRADVEEVARISRLYRERYAGFNAAHFHEIAQREHGVMQGDTFVKRLLQTAGLLAKRRPRGGTGAEEGAERRAARDRAITGDWFPVDQGAWRKRRK
jgi:hypothetical protein